MKNCACTNCECKTRLTKQRKVILEELRKVRTHPTAEEIFQAVQKHLPEISLATIYRNLDFLEKDGQISKLKHKDEDQKSKYDGFTGPHYHLICNKCGAIVDIEDCNCILMNKKDLAKKYGFTVNLNSIEIMGICKKCSEKNLNQKS